MKSETKKIELKIYEDTEGTYITLIDFKNQMKIKKYLKDLNPFMLGVLIQETSKELQAKLNK